MRHSRLHSTSCCVLSLSMLGFSGAALLAQSSPPPSRPPVTTPGPGSAGAAITAGRSVVIERAPVLFRDPSKYQIPLHLEPVRKLTLAATMDGVVTTVLTQVGQEVTPQAEVLRLDARDAQLKLARAQAALKAAKADLDAATVKPPAEARVEVAEADLKIAELDQTRTVVRSPLKGIVTAVLVVDGEYVHAGQPLVTVIDPSQFVVEVPIDGKTQKAGDTIDLKVEETNLPAKLAAVLPLSPQFDSLRELFVSPATGRVLLDNANGKWRAGQTVYSPMIPRLPVAEVPTAALVNADQGGRKVQVIREGFVRDIPVQTLGQLGADHLFVSGRFGGTDELVVKTSETLLDGARVTGRDAKTTGTPENPTQPGQPAAGGASF